MFAVVLFSTACMNGSGEPKKDEDTRTWAQSAWDYGVTMPCNAVTFANSENAVAKAYQQGLKDGAPILKVSSSDSISSLQASGKGLRHDENLALQEFNDRYNADNYQRSCVAFAVSALSGSACLASVFLMKGDATARKVQMGAGGVAATSFLTGVGLRWKDNSDLYKAMNPVAVSAKKSDD